MLTLQRSHFARVETAGLCEEWTADIKAAVRRVEQARVPASHARTRPLAESFAHPLVGASTHGHTRRELRASARGRTRDVRPAGRGAAAAALAAARPRKPSSAQPRTQLPGVLPASGLGCGCGCKVA